MTRKTKTSATTTKKKPARAAKPAAKRPASADLSRFQAMLENAPINVIFADRDLVIRYLNPASLRQLKALQPHLPIRAEEIVGQSIDIFHKSPAHQRRLLSDPKNLPHRAQIQLGPEMLDLLVSPIFDAKGSYLGPMVTWEVVTEKVRLQAEVARVMSMMDQAPMNVMFADREFRIRYLNPASQRTLRSLEKYLPIKADQVLGQLVDVFHKRPEVQRRMLSDPSNLPHRAEIELGPETLDLLVSPIFDQNKNYLGAMVTWEVITEKLATQRREREANESLKAVLGQVNDSAQAVASSSEELTAISRQMSVVAEETAAQANVVSAASEEISKSVQTVAAGTEEMSASIKEIAKNASDAARVASNGVSTAKRTTAIVVKLGDSSAEIGAVVKVITSIAEQTNLLALNATIEAARAGEAGKGFAVVANEVKELAKETAKATEDIRKKIETIQHDAKSSVEAIDQIARIIHEISDIQNTIAGSVEEQAATTNEMGRNVSEAARGVAEIAQNITKVAQTAQQATAGATETQNAAAELSRMAAELQAVASSAGDAEMRAPPVRERGTPPSYRPNGPAFTARNR